MKKLLFTILVPLFTGMLAGSAWAVGYHGTGLTPADSRCSFAANYSWLAWSGLDFSAYGTGNWFVRITDGSGYVAEGYAGVLGSGGTLGGELVTNGTFDSDTSGWSAENATLTQGTKGGRVNSLEVADNGSYSAATQVATTVIGANCLITGLRYSVGNVGNNANIYLWMDGSFVADRGDLRTSDQASVNTWETMNLIFTATSTTTMIGLHSEGALSAYFDDISLKEITEPAATGIHILDGIGGSEAWAKRETLFDMNDIVEIEILPAATLAGVGLSGVSVP